MTVHIYEQFGDYDQRLGRVNSYCVRKIKVVSDTYIDRDTVIGESLFTATGDAAYGRISGDQFRLQKPFPTSLPLVVIPTVQDYVVQPIRNNPLECFVAVIYRGSLVSFGATNSYPYTRSTTTEGRTIYVDAWRSTANPSGWAKASPIIVQKFRTAVVVPNTYVNQDSAGLKAVRLNARNAIGKLYTLENYGFPLSDKFIATAASVLQIANDQMYVEISYTGENDTPTFTKPGYATVPTIPAWASITGFLPPMAQAPIYTLALATDVFIAAGGVP